jgi:hypothetical protein
LHDLIGVRPEPLTLNLIQSLKFIVIEVARVRYQKNQKKSGATQEHRKYFDVGNCDGVFRSDHSGYPQVSVGLDVTQCSGPTIAQIVAITRWKSLIAIRLSGEL